MTIAVVVVVSIVYMQARITGDSVSIIGRSRASYVVTVTADDRCDMLLYTNSAGKHLWRTFDSIPL